MSYNILKKNVRFSGDSTGTIEGMVDTTSTQSITGQKTFTDFSGSDISLTTGLHRTGQSGTKIGLGNNYIAINAGGQQVIGAYGPTFDGGPKLQLSSLTNLFVPNTGKLSVGGPVNVTPDHALVVTGTYAHIGNITCSLGITASAFHGSAFHGDGSQLSNIGQAGSVAAANIIGTLSASQIDFNSPLRDLGGNLDIQLASNRGIVNDSGLALDVNNLSLYTSPTYDDSYNIIISGSGAIGNRRVALSWLEGGIELDAARITTGRFGNDKMPNNIAVTSVTATDVINAATSLSSSLVKSKRFNLISDDEQDILFQVTSGSSVSAGGFSSISMFNSSSTDLRETVTIASEIVGTGPFFRLQTNAATPEVQVQMYQGYVSASAHVSASAFANASGTLITEDGDFQGNNASFNEITASSVISSSAEISASSFHGDGSFLENMPPPELRFHYLNANVSLATGVNFVSVLTTAGNTNTGANVGTRFIAPAAGQIEYILLTPTNAGSVPTLNDEVEFGMVKNTSANSLSRYVPDLSFTGSFDTAYAIKDANLNTVNTVKSKLDIRAGSAQMTGSSTFAEGDLLCFAFALPDGAKNDIGISIVMTLSGNL